ncbi:MAG TPA: NYN domain-containing protein, partial [Rubrivivax sp.]|nr:NYN domain-containing protein [Rubrivivax sp.]
PMVNLASGKNSTDIAMAVDAIDLVLAERPQVVVIASSDSDFAPLVLRLREKGCVVRGIGQSGKTGAETQEIYDDFTVLDHHRRTSAPASEIRPPRKAATRTAATRTAPADTAGTSSRPTRTTASRKTPSRKAGTVQKVQDLAGDAPPLDQPHPSERPLPEATIPEAAATGDPHNDEAPLLKAAVGRTTAKRSGAAAKTTTRKTTGRKSAGSQAPADASTSAASVTEQPPKRAGAAAMDAVLACLPELAQGQGLALNVAVQRLREAQLLSRNSSSLKLFAQLSDRFELVPQGRPTRVRLRP